MLKKRWRWLQESRPVRTFSHFVDNGGGVLAAGMSYQAMFAVFAGLWLGFGIFSIWLGSRPDLLETLISQLNQLVPGLVGDGGLVEVSDLLTTRVLNWSSIVAGVALLWVALMWFTGTRRAIRIIFGLSVKQYRNAVLLKLRDLALAVTFLIVLLVGAALTVASSNLTTQVFEWIGLDPDNWLLGGLGILVRYGATFVFDVLVLIAIHVWLAEVRLPRWNLLWGCGLGGLVLLGLKVGGSSLLGGATTNDLLAPFAVLVGLLIWFNLVCRTLLLTASWIATGLDHTLGLPHNDRATQTA